MTVRFLQRVADDSGLLAPVRALLVGTGLSATYVPDGSLVGGPGAPGGETGYIRLDVAGGAVVTPAAVVAALAGQPIAPSSISVPAGSTLTQGPLSISSNSFTTTDATSHAACLVALPVNKIRSLIVFGSGLCTISGGGDVGKRYVWTSSWPAVITTGGTPSITNTPIIDSDFTGTPTSPSMDLVYGGGFLVLGCTGVAGDTILWSATIIMLGG